jgi:hypothetical protein
MHIFQLERFSQQTAATGPINLDPQQETELQPLNAENEVEDEISVGCHACSGVRFLLSKVTCNSYCPENGSCHACTSY